MAALSPHVWLGDGHGGAQDIAQLKDCFSVPDTERSVCWPTKPVTVLSAHVLSTGTLPLLTLLPHQSTPLHPQTFVPSEFSQRLALEGCLRRGNRCATSDKGRQLYHGLGQRHLPCLPGLPPSPPALLR